MSRIASSKTARIWAERFAQCERSNAPVAQRTQGGASLCPGVRWARILPSPERAEPIGASTHTLTVPRAALRFALGYLIFPLWGGDITTLSCGDCPRFLTKLPCDPYRIRISDLRRDRL